MFFHQGDEIGGRVTSQGEFGEVRVSRKEVASRCLGRGQMGDEHLRLFSEHNAQGVQASVYNVTAKNWIAPSEQWMISNREKTELPRMLGHIFRMQVTQNCRR